MAELSLADTVLASRYRIERELGRGGMGRVYAAADEHLGRRVAVKVILDEVNDEETRARFLREARAAAALSHPHACQLYEVAEHDGQPFLVMELLEGETLTARIARSPLSEPEAVGLLGELMSAVAAFHQAGLVHRDLKPSNVFLTERGIKLLDFGLARPTQRHDSLTATLLTSPGAVTGTMRHMAPEQVTGDPIDARTDVFALGVMLFEMLTGRVPFDAESNIEWLNAVLKDDPPTLDTPGLEHLDPIINRALQRRSADRYASVEEMSEALQAATTGQAVAEDGQAIAPQAAATAADAPAPVDADGDATKQPARSSGVRVQLPNASTAAPSRSSSSGVSKPAPNGTRRAVIPPFRVVQDDPELAPLQDGLPEALTVLLSDREHLQMVSNRVAPDDAGSLDMIALGKTLGVDRVLAGAVLRGDAELRVTVQWIDAGDGSVLWTQTRQYAIDNLLALQDRICADIISALPTN